MPCFPHLVGSLVASPPLPEEGQHGPHEGAGGGGQEQRLGRGLPHCSQGQGELEAGGDLGGQEEQEEQEEQELDVHEQQETNQKEHKVQRSTCSRAAREVNGNRHAIPASTSGGSSSRPLLPCSW